MRAYDYDDWVRRPRENARLIARLAQRRGPARRKPRDPVEAKLLQQAALESMRLREGDGRIVRVGPRRYEFR